MTVGAHREVREVRVSFAEIICATVLLAVAAFLLYATGMGVREYNNLRPNPSPLPTVSVPTSSTQESQ